MATQNEHTGDLIKSGKGNQQKYAEGWDRLFGAEDKPKEENGEGAI